MKCPICSDNRTYIFHSKVWHLKNGRVLRCASCDATFISPLMNEREERTFYAQYNKHVKARGVTVSRSADELHKFSRPAAKKRYEFIKSCLRKPKSILEIGSSTGAFLEHLKEKSKKKYLCAVEPCPENRHYSRKFCEDTYENIDRIPARKKFDAIVMFHVFEHIKKPVSFLKNCNSRLTNGGFVLAEVPCISDPLISLYDCLAFKDFYFQPMHPYIYSLKSLRYVFSKAGLKEKKVFYYQRYGFDNHLTWLSRGKPGGDKQLKKILGSDAQYKKSLQKAGITDTIFYMAGDVTDSIKI